MATEEEWRPVVGHDGYMVSNLGRVMSFRRKTPRVIRGVVGKRGYRTIAVPLGNGRYRMRYVHQLVADAFNGTRPTDGGCYEVRHLNGDKLDNRAVNVRWDRASENRYDLVRHGVHGQARKTHCPAGHEYTPENTYTLPSRPTARYCRPCHAEQSRARRAQLRAANVSTRSAA